MRIVTAEVIIMWFRYKVALYFSPWRQFEYWNICARILSVLITRSARGNSIDVTKTAE